MRAWGKSLVVLSSVALAALGLGACSTSSDQAKVTPLGACVKTIAPAVSASVPETKPVENGPVPEVTAGAGFGQKPTIAPGQGEAPNQLIRKFLVQGNGTEVSADATVLVNYVGQRWDGTVFDSSFDRGTPAAFSLDGVVQGWKSGLAGTHVGDRVELVIPPILGYGEITDEQRTARDQGDNSSNIHALAGETLVFVVDVLFAPPTLNESQLAGYTQTLKQSKPTNEELPQGLHILCDMGEEPQPAVVEGSKVPTKPYVVWTETGQGPEIHAGDIVGYVGVSGGWGDKPAYSSWTKAEGVRWGLAENLQAVGKTVGSRVVIVGPPNQQAPRGIIQVWDIVDVVPADSLPSGAPEASNQN